MQPNQEPDIPKIIFVGIPLLLMVWGCLFVLLIFLTRDMNTSKYGAFILFLLAIPTYGFLAIKNASKLKAVLHENEKEIRNGEIIPTGRKRYITNFELCFLGSLVFLLVASLYICVVILGVSSKIISKYIIIAIPIVIIIEILARKILHKNKPLELDNDLNSIKIVPCKPLPSSLKDKLERMTSKSSHRLELLNDESTPMEYVLNVLTECLGIEEAHATQLMLETHTRGMTQILSGSEVVLKELVRHITNDARSKKYPLNFIVKEVEEMLRH